MFMYFFLTYLVSLYLAFLVASYLILSVLLRRYLIISSRRPCFAKVRRAVLPAPGIARQSHSFAWAAAHHTPGSFSKLASPHSMSESKDIMNTL